MEKEFDLVPVQSLPLEKVLEVLILALGRGNEAYKKSEALWRWKHLKSPFGPSYAFAALDPDTRQIASVRLLMYWNFVNLSGETITAARAVDVSTHPDYRRMGLFSILTKKALEDLTQQGVSVIYATPKLKGKSIGGYLKLDFTMIDPWPVYIKVLHPLSFLKGITIGRKRSTIQFVPGWDDVFDDDVLSFNELLNKYPEQELGVFLDEADQNRKAISGWRIKKDYKFISWRYGEHPNVDFGFVPLAENGKLTALGIIRRNVRYEMIEVVISELLFLDSKDSLGEKLLKKIKNSIKADYLIAHYNKNTSELSALKRSKFIKAPGQDIVFLIKELAAKRENFVSHVHWNLSLGDIELF